MATSRIAELASIIQTNTAKLETQYISSGLALPAFDAARLMLSLPPEIASYRTAVLEATDELHSLIKGPIEIVTDRAVSDHTHSTDVIAHAAPAKRLGEPSCHLALRYCLELPRRRDSHLWPSRS